MSQSTLAGLNWVIFPTHTTKPVFVGEIVIYAQQSISSIMRITSFVLHCFHCSELARLSGVFAHTPAGKTNLASEPGRFSGPPYTQL